MKTISSHTMLLLLIFFCFLILHLVVSARLCSYDEGRALMEFKKSFTINSNASIYSPYCSSSSYAKTNSWSEGQDCCYWDGVTCDTTTGQVIGLDLSCSWLQGQLSSNNSLFLLQHLQILNLANNNFTPFDISLKNGLPSSVGNLKSLKYLSVSGCGITGSIPDSIRNLTSLEHLDLSSNPKLVGSIPNFSNLSLLHTVNLYFNSLTGTIPLSLYSLPLLRNLDISYNNFTGGQLHPFQSQALEVIHLPGCSLQGPIPFILFPHGANQLTTLDFRINSLNGTIPSSLFTLASLLRLNLGHNQLVGAIPEFKSTSLQEIYISDNNLEGNIPSSIFNLANLTRLSFSSNRFSGTIDTSMLSKLQNLVGLYGSNNSLSFTNGVNLNHLLPNLKYLYFRFNNLTHFPDFLRGSKVLSYLNLSNNKIDGPIPDWLWDVGRDTLDYLILAHNSLTRIDKLPWIKLRYVDLRSNLLRGPLLLPPYKLTAYFISNNSLTGDIPTLICNTSSMEAFDLSRNYFSGPIPECLGNITTLTVLDLSTNRFHGRIPNFSSHNESSLKTLNLNGNQLEGKLPTSLVNCKKLEVLDVGNNNINDTFPYWLQFHTELRVLVLRSNDFHGYIHDYKYRQGFQKLRIFDISNNNFVGSLPTRYVQGLEAIKGELLGWIDDSEYMESYYGSANNQGSYYQDSVSLTIKGININVERILTTFMSIDFSKNKFGGEIPQVFGTLISLKSLNLSHNSLVGHIPTSIGNLRNLESLDLSSNKLSGTIPRELASITFLGKLNLSLNALVGLIPSANNFDTRFDNSSYQQNLALCGPPLSKTCSNGNKEKPPQVLHEEEGSDDFDKKIIFYGYISGFVTGLSIGYMILSGDLPMWLVKMIQRYQLRKLKDQIQLSRGRS